MIKKGSFEAAFFLPVETQMTLIIHWQPATEDTFKVIRVTSECVSLDVYLAGSVIQKTVWRKQKHLLEQQHDSVMAWRIKQYLQNVSGVVLQVGLKQQGTVFSNRVWNELCKIPYGQTITYSELAERVDSGARAVANACRKNPFPGIIPCHRVVSLSGIGGFMGQSQGEYIEIKRRLIEYEAFIKERGDDNRFDGIN